MAHVHVPGLEIAEAPDAVPDAAGIRAFLRRLVPPFGGVQVLALREPARAAPGADRMAQTQPGLRHVALHAGLLHARVDEPAPGAVRLRHLDRHWRPVRPVPRL